jgi:hypothetical protein
MKISFKIFASIILVLALNLIVHAKEWRGIVPLHSNRGDVERILGLPSRPSGGNFSTYFLDEGLVQIIYAGKGYPSSKDCPKAIPQDTVLVIYVSPKPENNLQPDVSGFREFNPSSPEDMGLKAYYGEKDGVIIVTGKGGVFLICYMARAEDEHFCRRYYNPENLVRIRSDYI